LVELPCPHGISSVAESDSDGINSLEEVNQEKQFFFPAPNILVYFWESLLRHHSGDMGTVLFLFLNLQLCQTCQSCFLLSIDCVFI